MARKRRRSQQPAPPAPAGKLKAPGRGTWRLMDRGSSMLAGLLAARISAVAWRAATGRKPPTSGRHPDVSTGEALTWAVVGGGLIELVKVFVRRWTATYWVRSTGKLPPGMKPLTAQRLRDGTEPVPTGSAPRKRSTRRLSRRSRRR